MKIKTFRARTFGEALERVKRELSDDAVILSSQEQKGARPCVEVTAAVDYDMAAPGGGAAAGTQAAAAYAAQGPAVRRAAVPEAPPSSPAGDGIEQLRSELGSLRRSIETMRRNGFELALPPHKHAVYRHLVDRSIRDEHALRLCEQAKDLADLPRALSADLDVKCHLKTRKAVMFAGPTGSGKTTTIAKLAARAVKSGKRAAIINLDTYRIGAVEQVRIYARILGIPLAVATTAAEFRQHLAKFSAERDVVLIDTTGRNPRDGEAISDLAELCRTDVPLELHLLMGMNTDDQFLLDARRAYGRLPITYIAFSKVDEAVRFGSIYNLARAYQKPVSYLTTGQTVPGDIEPAAVGRLADLILRGTAAN